MKKTPNWVRGTLVALLLALATLAVYWPVGNYHFTDLDDKLYVTENPIVQQGLTLHGLTWAFTTWTAWNWHPLTWLSHQLDCQLFGLNAGAHHWVNVGFHLVNTLLLFFVLSRMTGALERSGFVAALFALHPLHVESVAWVAERKDVLSAFFWILAMGSYNWYARGPRLGRYLLTLLLFACGLMSKPMMVTLPFVFLLLDYWPLRRIQWDAETSKRPGASIRRLLLEKCPFFALVLGSSIVTFLAQGSAVRSLEKFPVSVRVANALVSYASYIGKTICPENLAVLYPHPGMPAIWMILGAASLLGCISLLALALVRRRPYLLVGWLWYLGTLVPVIGLVQAGEQAMADRYTYLPIIGLSLMAVWGIGDILADRPIPRAAWGAGTAILFGVLAMISSAQLRHWQNSLTLFGHAVQATTNNAVALYNLGLAFSEQGEVAEAIPCYAEALRVKPEFDSAHYNLGLCLVMVGRTSEGTNHYAQALRINPRNENAHLNYGLALASCGEVDEAIAHWEAVLKLSPSRFQAHHFLGKALVAKDKVDEAVRHYFEALRFNPDFEEAHVDLGAALVKQGKPAQALEHFAQVLRLNPNNAEAHGQMALILATQHQTKEAITHYREALRIEPANPTVLNNLAWLLATHPDAEFRDGVEAVRLAESACRLSSFGLPAFIGTLAAAYAEAGKFDEAVKAAGKACSLAASLGQTNVAARNRRLLDIYKTSSPYRETP